MARQSIWGNAMHGARYRPSKRSGRVAKSGQQLCASSSKSLHEWSPGPASLSNPKLVRQRPPRLPIRARWATTSVQIHSGNLRPILAVCMSLCSSITFCRSRHQSTSGGLGLLVGGRLMCVMWSPRYCRPQLLPTAPGEAAGWPGYIYTARPGPGTEAGIEGARRLGILKMCR